MEIRTLRRKMEKGARHRNNPAKNHPGGSSPDTSPQAEAGSGGGGVALKKEIGLVSACGIIVGESRSSTTPAPPHPLSRGPPWGINPSMASKAALLCLRPLLSPTCAGQVTLWESDVCHTSPQPSQAERCFPQNRTKRVQEPDGPCVPSIAWEFV